MYGEPGIQDLGTETITVIGTDITGGTGWTTMTIVIKRNYIPVIVVPFQDMYAEKDILFTQAFADSNFFDANTNPSDDLVYSIDGNPDWFTLDTDVNTFSGTPPEDGEWEITFTIDDGW